MKASALPAGERRLVPSGLVTAGIRQRLLWADCSARREPIGLSTVKDERLQFITEAA